VIRTIAMLDAEGNLDLAALGLPYRTGDTIEYFIAGDSLVMCRLRGSSQAPSESAPQTLPPRILQSNRGDSPHR